MVPAHRGRAAAGGAGPRLQAVLVARARRRHAAEQQAALHEEVLECSMFRVL